MLDEPGDNHSEDEGIDLPRVDFWRDKKILIVWEMLGRTERRKLERRRAAAAQTIQREHIVHVMGSSGHVPIVFGAVIGVFCLTSFYLLSTTAAYAQMWTGSMPYIAMGSVMAPIAGVPGMHFLSTYGLTALELKARRRPMTDFKKQESWFRD